MTVHIGLISDTHMPERCAQLPQRVFEALAGVDFVLHAGDVGELWVLDELSRIAPIFAVHGNDDTLESQRELPYQQVIFVNGERTLLTHSHWPERVAELASRRSDVWQGKLDRRTSMAKRAGASVIVYGHTHVPMAHQHEGVLLVNPGAIASGNYVTRQCLRSVARMQIGDDGAISVVHIDLATGQPFAPHIDWPAGYRAALQQTSESILSPWLQERWEHIHAAAQPTWSQFCVALLRAANRVWSGECDLITPEMLLAEVCREDPTGSALAAVEQVLT